MIFPKCILCMKVLSCELFGLVLLTAICIVWILGWTGHLPVISKKLENIQSYSEVVNAVYSCCNIVIVIVLAIRSKKKLTQSHPRDSELGLINNQVIEAYGAIENMRCGNETSSVLLQDNMQVIIAQNKDLLTNCKRMLDILDSPSSPLVVKNIPKKAKVIKKSKGLPRIKLILVGDSGTGKTCILHCWNNESFDYNKIATVGMDFIVKVVTTNIGDLCFQVWDTGGSEAFRTVTMSHVKICVCCIIVFDISCPSTLSTALEWYATIKKSKMDENDYYAVFVCNKIDLLPEIDQQTIDKKLNGMPCFYVSAKTGENVQHALSLIALGAMVKNFATQSHQNHINS